MDDTMSTKDFLEKIAIDLKRDPKTMAAVISKLEEEWYDSVDSLRKISDETMNQLGIPKRLQTEIKERLQKPTSVEEAKAPIIPPEPLKSPAKNEWQLILMMITDEIVLHEKIRKTLGIFEKIIKNILSNPEEEKFRTVRLTNPTIKNSIGIYSAATQFMIKLGFKEINSELVLDNQGLNLVRLKNALEAVYDIQKLYAEEEVTAFNPYKSSVTSLAEFQEVKIEDYDIVKMKAAIKEEKEKRLKAEQTVITDREVIIYKIDPNANINSAIEFAAEDKKRALIFSEKEDEEATHNFLRLRKENEDNQEFKSKAKLQLEKVRSKPIISSARIKLRFPDLHVVQATFSPTETMEFVYNFFKDFLAYKAEFNLFMTPPRRIISPSKKTLKELNLLPASVLFFEWKEGAYKDFLSSEALSKYLH